MFKLEGSNLEVYRREVHCVYLKWEISVYATPEATVVEDEAYSGLKATPGLDGGSFVVCGCVDSLYQSESNGLNETKIMLMIKQDVKAQQVYS